MVCTGVEDVFAGVGAVSVILVGLIGAGGWHVLAGGSPSSTGKVSTSP